MYWSEHSFTGFLDGGPMLIVMTEL